MSHRASMGPRRVLTDASLAPTPESREDDPMLRLELVENVEYLRALGGASLLFWLVRGIGTAVLHGATTAIQALMAKGASDRHPERGALGAAPGVAVAVAVHSAFNHALVSPLLAALLLLLALPAVVVVV